MIPLMEQERRRVEFAGGTPIILPNREPWRFFDPHPVERDFHDEDGIAHVIAWEFGPGVDAETNDSLGRGFQRLIQKIDRADNREDRACGLLEAAWYLLARNYVISQDEFEDLLLRGAVHGPARRKRLYDGLRDLVGTVIGRVGAMVESKAEGSAA
jgi:hypothetical protein